MRDLLETIEEDYHKIKKKFQTEDNLEVAFEIAEEIFGHEEILKDVFKFLVRVFDGEKRRDNLTPLVFHSIYLVRLASKLGCDDINTLLTIALHDVLEDTNVSKESLEKEEFIKGKEHLIEGLLRLSEDKSLSREPDGKNLPPRYENHIKKLIGANVAVINTEILDRFSDMIDLEYITKLPEEQKILRLKAKLIKVQGFILNITKGRNDFNKKFLELFEMKIENFKRKWGIDAEIPIINT